MKNKPPYLGQKTPKGHSTVLAATPRDAKIEVYVSSMAAISRVLDQPPKTIESMARRADAPVKTGEGWPIVAWAKFILKKRQGIGEQEKAIALRQKKASSRLTSAKALIAMTRAKSLAGQYVSAEEAVALRMRLIRVFTGTCDSAPMEIAAVLKLTGTERRFAITAMEQWFARRRQAIVDTLKEEENEPAFTDVSGNLRKDRSGPKSGNRKRA